MEHANRHMDYWYMEEGTFKGMFNFFFENQGYVWFMVRFSFFPFLKAHCQGALCILKRSVQLEIGNTYLRKNIKYYKNKKKLIYLFFNAKIIEINPSYNKLNNFELIFAIIKLKIQFWE